MVVGKRKRSLGQQSFIESSKKGKLNAEASLEVEFQRPKKDETKLRSIVVAVVGGPCLPSFHFEI